MSVVIKLDSPLTQTYMAHVGLLVIKLLALSPVTAMTWIRKGFFPNPDVVRRAYLSELKILSPFWIVSALYVTTNPPTDVGIILFRLYTVSRLLVILGYTTRPVPAVFTDLALIVSYSITCYMSCWVVFCYRKAL